MEFPFYEFDLSYLLEDSSKFAELSDPIWVRNTFYQIAKGVFYLHSQDVVHRRLSPECILTNDKQRFVIGGLAYAISIHSLGGNNFVSQLPSLNPSYYAPELFYMDLQHQPTHNWKPIDMWALGCIFAHLLHQSSKGIFSPLFHHEFVLQSILEYDCLPVSQFAQFANFPEVDKCLRNLARMNVQPKLFDEAFEPQFFPGVQALNLLKKLLQFNPASRLTIEELFRDEYFSGLPYPSLDHNIIHGCMDSEIPAFISSKCAGFC